MRHVTHGSRFVRGGALQFGVRTLLTVAVRLLAALGGVSVAVDLLGCGLVKIIRPAGEEVAVLDQGPQA